jgi:hypothetical protein
VQADAIRRALPARARNQSSSLGPSAALITPWPPATISVSSGSARPSAGHLGAYFRDRAATRRSLSARPPGSRKEAAFRPLHQLVGGREHLNWQGHIEQLNLRKRQDFGRAARLAGIRGFFGDIAKQCLAM